MSEHPIDPPSRRDFFGRIGQLSVVAVLPAYAAPAKEAPAEVSLATEGAYDLSWVAQLRKASDRAVVDSASISGFGMELATRFLDNCDAAYGVGKHQARVVLNLRTRAIPLALSDETWNRFALGVEYDVKEPGTQVPAVRNPFLTVPAGSVPQVGSIRDLLARRSIILVCDFALGHLANRIAAKSGGAADAVHRELLAGIVPGVYPVPSGIFGMARAQNAGCAFVSG